MAKTVSLTLPLTRADLADLQVGDEVLLSGPVYTMRDAGHERALQCLEDTGHAPLRSGRRHPLLRRPHPRRGRAPLGLGRPHHRQPHGFRHAGVSSRPASSPPSARASAAPRSCSSCQETGSVYLCTVGGIAALLAKSVTESELVGWEDLGTEALRKLTLKDFPVYVAVDTKGGDLYREIEAAAQSARQSSTARLKVKPTMREALGGCLLADL